MISFAEKQENMNIMFHFPDKSVPYEVFIKDLAREVAAQTSEAFRKTKPSNSSAREMFAVG